MLNGIWLLRSILPQSVWKRKLSILELSVCFCSWFWFSLFLDLMEVAYSNYSHEINDKNSFPLCQSAIWVLHLKVERACVSFSWKSINLALNVKEERINKQEINALGFENNHSFQLLHFVLVIASVQKKIDNSLAYRTKKMLRMNGVMKPY